MSDRYVDMNIEPTLKYLLTRSDPFICLVKGQWGVGKTYFIKKFIRDNRAIIVKSNFAYISLFGVSSIEELTQAIFVNSVSTKTLDTTLSDALSSDEALSTRAKYLFDRAKPLLARAGGLPIFGVNAMRGFTLGTMAHFFNRNSLIVIDDLERHSAGLPVRDILGVITHLKEERGCQIIIVMNEDALTKDSDAPYFETKEKVIDRELTIEPTVDEAIAIGLTDYQDKNSLAANGCRKLQVANIRTIQKIDAAVRQFRDVLEQIQVRVPQSFDQQLQSTAVLAVWAHWERVIDIDALENLELGDTASVLMDSREKLPEKLQEMYQLLREYEYGYSDDTDKMIIRFVKTGVIDPDEMRLRVQENDSAVAKRTRDEAIEHAWDFYTKTLRPNEGEVVKSLYETHLAGIEDVQIASLSQAVWVLRQLGHEAEADDLTDRYLDRKEPIARYGDYPFREMVIDEKFLERWREATDREDVDERDINATILSYYGQKSSTIDDIKRLSQFTADDYYRWFTTADDPSLLAVVKALARLQYGLPTLEAETARVEAAVRAALEQIASESKINALRLRSLIAPPARPKAPADKLDAEQDQEPNR
jgi:hypothetical protein